MPCKAIESFDQFIQILHSDRVAVIDFWADWCRTRTSPLKKFADLDEFKNVDFYTCDSEEQEPVAYECSIPGMPSFVTIHSGHKIDEIAGASPQKLERMVKMAAQISAESSSESDSDKEDVR